MLNTTIAKEGDVCVVYLAGELSATTEDELTKLLLGLASDGNQQLILDLSEIGYLSSNGLRPLLAWLGATKTSSGKRCLAVCGLQEFVQAVFHTTGFDRKFPTYDTVDSALGSF